MDITITQIAKTTILIALNKHKNASYRMADILEIVMWSNSIEITTRDNKTHSIPYKIG